MGTMIGHGLLRVGVILLAAGSIAPSHASGPAADGAGIGEVDPQAREILSRLDRRLAATTALTGSFVQTFTSSGLGVPQSESGVFSIRRPDLMRWEYRRPERKLAVSDGTHTWLYMPDEKLAYRGDVREWKRGGAFAILAGGSLVEEFAPVDLSIVEATRKGDLVLRLRPVEIREEYDFLLIQFEPSSLTINTITAIDAMGNRVTIILSGLEEPRSLPDDEFTFDPPSGTRIIDQSAPATPADLSPGRLR
jgi:outer membrane lipoprotein carrier protein